MSGNGDRSGGGRPAVEGRSAPSAAVLHGKIRLQDLEPDGRTVLVRADLNVPVDNGRVRDATRIEATVPTVRHLLRSGAAVVLMSHRGRPSGRRVVGLSLAPVADVLAEYLEAPVSMAPACTGPDVEALVENLQAGQVLLLENLRYEPGETANDPGLARDLARLAPLFVNDAFGASHREHASIVGVPAHVEQAAAGDLLYREVTQLSRVLVNPAAPFVLVLGGAKVADKVGVIANLLPMVDRIVIGGAMANAFLAAQGREIGGSLAPSEAIEQARGVLAKAEAQGIELTLPTDLVAAPGLDAPEKAHIVDAVAADEMALDIGPDSRTRFAAALRDARTVVWNGPMGVFETAPFDHGTRAVAEAVAGLESEAFTVLGGGDTVAAAAAAEITARVSHVSTGGGASLDLLAGSILPGVAALTDKEAFE